MRDWELIYTSVSFISAAPARCEYPEEEKFRGWMKGYLRFREGAKGIV